MSAWFRRQGLPVDALMAASLEAAVTEREAAARLSLKCGQMPSEQQLAAGGKSPLPIQEGEAGHVAGGPPAPAAATAVSSPSTPVQTVSTSEPTTDWLLLSNFDHTLVDFDAGERVMEQLAPELLPMLVGLDASTSSLPITNTLLAELQRRGVSRDTLLSSLHALGASEVPAATLELLRFARQHGSASVRLLADANSVFLSHILAGAKATALVDDITANPASFERVLVSDSPAASSASSEPLLSTSAPRESGLGQLGSATPADAGGPAQQMRGAGQKLVVKPRCCGGGTSDAACSRCPEGLCKGREVRALRQQGVYRNIILCGAGASDICPALALGPGDVVLARRGYPLVEYAERNSGMAARLLLWGTQEELCALVRQQMMDKVVA